MTFEGFEPANTTPVPDKLFDELLSELSGAELKAILYIIRRTWGFKKTTDAISYNQFLHGIITRDNRQLDKGCGITNRSVLSRALASLEVNGYIFSDKGDDPLGDKATTVYGIRFREARVVSNRDYPQDGGGIKSGLPRVVSNRDYGGIKSGLPVVSNRYLQETVIQGDSSRSVSRNGRGDSPSSTHVEEGPIAAEPLPQSPPSLELPIVISAIETSSLLSTAPPPLPEEGVSTDEAVTEKRPTVHAGSSPMAIRSADAVEVVQADVLEQETTPRHGQQGAASIREGHEVVTGISEVGSISFTSIETERPTMSSNGHTAGTALPEQPTETVSPTKTRKPRGNKNAEPSPQKPILALSAEGVLVATRWEEAMQKKYPHTDKYITACNLLGPCEPSVEDLQQCRLYCFKSNPKWFRGIKKGAVTILDIANNWEAFQSSQEIVPDEVEEDVSSSSNGKHISRDGKTDLAVYGIQALIDGQSAHRGI